MECLEKNEICKSNLKCKECKLLDCKNVLNMLEEQKKMMLDYNERKFIKFMEREYPNCLHCNHLEILNLEQCKVRCPYMLKKCVLKK